MSALTYGTAADGGRDSHGFRQQFVVSKSK